MKEIIIDGVTYVKKTEEVDKHYIICRTYSAGVHIGIRDFESEDSKKVILSNAKRLWYWDGAASISQLAMEGVSKPENCKFPCVVTQITLSEVIEIIPCTAKAVKSIYGVKVWKA